MHVVAECQDTPAAKRDVALLRTEIPLFEQRLKRWLTVGLITMAVLIVTLDQALNMLMHSLGL